MFSNNVLRKIYALSTIKQEDFDSSHGEIPSWKRQSSLRCQGNDNAQHDKAADIELEHNEENAVDGEEVEAAPVELDRWQGTGYTMKKKRHSMMALFSSCYKAKSNSD